MLGLNGEHWVPVHGIVRHSQARTTIETIIALFERHSGAMDRLGVGAGYMSLTVGSTGFLIEPVFYLPEFHGALHNASVEPAQLSKLTDFPETPEARALVEALRAEIIAIFGRMDATHLRVDRTYPLRERSDPGTWSILESLKAAVDPQVRMNPGVLGL